MTFLIKFANIDSLPVNGILKAADFIVEKNDGVPTFLEGKDKPNPKYTAASWVTLPYDRMSISAEGQVSIQTTVKIPADAQPGGRYFAVLFEPTSDENKSDFMSKEEAVAPRIASLVYLRVSGPVKDDALVKQLTAPGFLEYGPIKITSEILNRGNYHINPQGNISITNMFGQIVAQEKLADQNIFPEASRIFTNQLGEKWMFGKYKISLNATYGDSGKVLTATVFTWVFPWKIASVITLAIIIIILIFFVIFRNMRRQEEQLEKKVEELEEKIEEEHKL